MELNCPQCKKALSASTARLVQDSCGHKKCRLCLVEDEIECKTCLAEKSSNDGFDNHTAVITPNKFNSRKIHPAKNVNKRSYNSIAVPSHVTILPGNPVLYKCNICMKMFRTKSHIRYHNYCIGGGKPFRCDTCKKEFISKYHLETHMIGHLQPTKYACDVCDRSFSQNIKLIYHKLTHYSTKSFVCQQCGKMFKTREYLRRHTMIHKSEKHYACKKCDAKFNNSSNLSKHKYTHVKEKVHMCDECGKRFKSKVTLRYHRYLHTQVKSHKCTICGKAFADKRERNRHQLIHSDLKPFSCSLCGTSFRRKDNVYRHARSAHPGVKPIVIKNQVNQSQSKPLPQEKPQENPNAINVITGPPTTVAKSEPILSKPVPVINAPLKLAFKTTAFKSNYNIHSREYVEPPRIQTKPYDYEESVSICQKILQPSNSPPTIPRTIIKTLGNVSEKDSNEICHKILAPTNPSIISTDTSYSIRNIKFKLPDKYINLSKKNILNEINVLKPVENSSTLDRSDLTYTDLTPVKPINGATSVIVNTSSAYTQNEMHWRRRTLQNLELNLKQPDKV